MSTSDHAAQVTSSPLMLPPAALRERAGTCRLARNSQELRGRITDLDKVLVMWIVDLFLDGQWPSNARRRRNPDAKRIGERSPEQALIWLRARARGLSMVHKRAVKFTRKSWVNSKKEGPQESMSALVTTLRPFFTCATMVRFIIPMIDLHFPA
ncbi:hypothetical protein CLAIMM_06534 [Cladophialophora immunda]|nr:hypothetical protein CLAIMM_06534 [Cladophialophora immunda]